MRSQPHPLLQHLPEAVAEHVQRRARRRRFGAGEIIVHEADPADSLHLIQNGRVAVSVTSRTGNQVTVRIMGTGEFFGELALLTPSGLRTATVRALEATETLSVHQRDFEEMRHQHPAVCELLARLLAERVRDLTVQLEEALYTPAEVRVRRRLVRLADLYAEGGPTTMVPLTQEQLAAMAGTARATANRVLQQETRAGAVQVSRNRVVVLDRMSLARRAGLG